MINSSIASLAILKINWDQGHDYIDNFVPFALEAIIKIDAPISVANVQAYIKNNFGLQIPQGALKTLLRRLASRGYIQLKSHVYIRTDKEPMTDISVSKADALRQQRGLFSKLAAFANKTGKQNWSDEDAGNALLSYLETEFLPILAAHINGQAILTQKENSTAAQLIINEFVVEISEEDPMTFSFLETVTKGHMLATALFVQDISKVAQKFQDLSVYLDTKILLWALGFEGEGPKAYCNELLNLLDESNISLFCFDVTLDEVKRILAAAQHFLRNPQDVNRVFLVYENFLANGSSPSDVEVVINNLPRALRALKVLIKEQPAHTDELGLDERRLEELMCAELPAQQEDAQLHDIRCLTAIYRLRKGRVTKNIEKCKYLFLTLNNAIARASNSFFNEHNAQTGVPLCINDYTLATLAWVKRPELDNELQKNRLIATAYAAIQPSPKLWKQYLLEVNRLKALGHISDTDYHLLRFSTVAKTALIETTGGELSAFTEGTIPEIVEKARADARRETEVKLDDERKRREMAEQEVRSINKSVHEKARNLEQRLEDISLWCGKGIKGICILFLAFIFLFGLYQAHSLPIPNYLKSEYGAGLAITLVLTFLYSIWNMYSGGSLRNIGDRIERRSSIWVKERLTQYMLKEDRDS